MRILLIFFEEYKLYYFALCVLKENFYNMLLQKYIIFRKCISENNKFHFKFHLMNISDRMMKQIEQKVPEISIQIASRSRKFICADANRDEMTMFQLSSIKNKSEIFVQR